MTNKKELNNEELEQVSGGFFNINGKPFITPQDLIKRDGPDIGSRVKIYKVIELTLNSQKIEFVTKGTISSAEDTCTYALGDDGITYKSTSVQEAYILGYGCEYVFEWLFREK